MKKFPISEKRWRKISYNARKNTAYRIFMLPVVVIYLFLWHLINAKKIKKATTSTMICVMALGLIGNSGLAMAEEYDSVSEVSSTEEDSGGIESDDAEIGEEENNPYQDEEIIDEEDEDCSDEDTSNEEAKQEYNEGTEEDDEWKTEFVTKYADILRLASDDNETEVTIEYKERVLEAIEEYEGLSDEQREILSEEGKLLKKLIERIKKLEDEQEDAESINPDPDTEEGSGNSDGYSDEDERNAAGSGSDKEKSEPDNDEENNTESEKEDDPDKRENISELNCDETEDASETDVAETDMSEEESKKAEQEDVLDEESKEKNHNVSVRTSSDIELTINPYSEDEQIKSQDIIICNTADEPVDVVIEAVTVTVNKTIAVRGDSINVQDITKEAFLNMELETSDKKYKSSLEEGVTEIMTEVELGEHTKSLDVDELLESTYVESINSNEYAVIRFSGNISEGSMAQWRDGDLKICVEYSLYPLEEDY